MLVCYPLLYFLCSIKPPKYFWGFYTKIKTLINNIIKALLYHLDYYVSNTHAGKP